MTRTGTESSFARVVQCSRVSWFAFVLSGLLSVSMMDGVSRHGLAGLYSGRPKHENEAVRRI